MLLIGVFSEFKEKSGETVNIRFERRFVAG